MKRAAVLILLLLVCRGAQAAKPILGVAGFGALSPREGQLAQMLELHLDNIARSIGVFDLVNSALLRDQMAKFGCRDESCILEFSRDAGINVVISGSVRDLGDHLLFSIRAHSPDVPYDDKAVYRYSVEVPLYAKYTVTEFSYICEEQAGHFLAGLMSAYRRPVYFGNGQSVSEGVSGSYDVYRIAGANEGSLRRFYAVGKTVVSAGAVVAGHDKDIRAGDFILLRYEDKSRFLKDFYYGRKKEVIFEPPAYQDALYMLLLTGPASALMPVVAPIFGYYRTADWTGLALWALNVAPYLYFEINGFVHYPGQYRDRHKNISRQTMAQWHFAWYFAFAGGAALFVDAFANDYLKTATNYLERRRFMGNPLCAAYLALVSGGAGHFYRGHRLWGYFYFHLNNALLYLIINEFSPGERYDRDRDRYVREGINETRGYAYAGVFCALKIAEVVHAVLIKDRIRGGDVVEDSASFEPVLYPGENGVSVGLQCNYRF
ncbi:MAG TPA: hypothetical protein P5295_06265 [Spirochaetota bacterium]|nr:hypothetical protein [Spirochaetota bacterium]